MAQLKLREARLARVAQEAQARDGDIVDVTEYLKPGPEEIFGSAAAAARALGARPRAARPRLAAQGHAPRGFRVSCGCKAAGGAQRWRPRTLRFAEEEAWVERWLGLVERTLAVESGGGARGGGDGRAGPRLRRHLQARPGQLGRIMDGVVEPMLAGTLPRAHFADAVLQARLAASKDPEGEALAGPSPPSPAGRARQVAAE